MLFPACKQWKTLACHTIFALSISNMKTKQTIAVLGTINEVAAGVCKNIAAGNFRLVFPGTLNTPNDWIVTEIKNTHPLADVESTVCTVDACWESDIILAFLPFSKGENTLEKIRNVANQKVVICIPVQSSESDFVNVHSNGENTGLQQLLPYCKVVVATPGFAGTKERIQFTITGNNEEAIETAAELLESKSVFNTSTIEPVKI